MGPRRGPSRGFTLLELVVVIAIVAFVASLAADRMLRYAELAEKGAMEHTVGSLKSALSLRFAAFYVKGGLDAIDRLPAENPMDWLAERPASYVGVLRDPAAGDFERPAWYYDPGPRQLVYAPRRTRHLVGGDDTRLRFRVVVRFAPDPELGGLKRLDRIGIDAEPAYDWFRTLD